MVQEITWSPEALRIFLEIVKYLEENWTNREVNQFIDKVDENLSNLQIHPRLGAVRNKKLNIHKTILHKKVILIYKYKPRKQEIVLLTFWNVQQNPGRLKY